MSVDIILIILRILLIILLYLFLMQVVLVITRDLRKRATTDPRDDKRAAPQAPGHLIFIDSNLTTMVPGTRFDLLPHTTIGRGPTNTIQLTDSFISGEHAHLWYRDGTWYVQDPGSTNGTFVNGMDARSQPLPVKPGEIIKLGNAAYISFKLVP